MSGRHHSLKIFGHYAVGLVLLTLASVWIASTYLGPTEQLEGTIDIAVEGRTQGGTGVRGGGGQALDIVLEDRLSDSPYQPTFRLSLGFQFLGAESAYQLGQSLPRGTPVSLRVSGDDYQGALDYGERRAAREAAGEREPATMTSPWVVQIHSLAFDRDGERVEMTASRFATWFFVIAISVIGIAALIAGREAQKNRELDD